MEEKCPECRIGRYRAVTLPYIRPLGKRMLVLPNAPALRCDMCGEVVFDDQFEWDFEQILGQLIRKEPPVVASPPLEHKEPWTVAGGS